MDENKPAYTEEERKLLHEILEFFNHYYIYETFGDEALGEHLRAQHPELYRPLPTSAPEAV